MFLIRSAKKPTSRFSLKATSWKMGRLEALSLAGGALERDPPAWTLILASCSGLGFGKPSPPTS